jgi:acyl carrier protein phosphodiesterase
MNFLAHLYLSGDDPKIMVGNFIGDFVKGKNQPGRFEAGITFGIGLHRSIDEYTDRHPIVKASKQRLSEKYRHYSGVIVDMFYDHFLSSNWDHFHSKPIAEYSASAYRVLQSHDTILPERIARILPYMIEGNWLVGYGSVHGIGRALSGMAQRTPFKSKMEDAVGDLTDHYPLFKEEFMSFMPDLKSFADGLIRDFQQGA